MFKCCMYLQITFGDPTLCCTISEYNNSYCLCIVKHCGKTICYVFAPLKSITYDEYICQINQEDVSMIQYVL